MSDPCPSCGAPLSLGGTFCKECGYDVELQAAEWRGEATELPDEEFDYEATLAREGLGEPARKAGLPWGVLLVLLVATIALVGVVLLRTR
jgi:uncharacterized Zn finger protein (UPF0148 family)